MTATRKDVIISNDDTSFLSPVSEAVTLALQHGNLFSSTSFIFVAISQHPVPGVFRSLIILKLCLTKTEILTSAFTTFVTTVPFFNMSLEFQTPTACNTEAGDNDGILKQIYRHVTEIKEDAMNQKANDYFSSLCNTNTEKP